MLADAYAVANNAMEESVSGSKHRRAIRVALDLDAVERGLTEREAMAKVADHVLLLALDNIQNERRYRLQPVDDRPRPLDRDTDVRRLERTLLHPARQHARFRPGVTDCQHEHPARHPAQGCRQLLPLFRLCLHGGLTSPQECMRSLEAPT